MAPFAISMEHTNCIKKSIVINLFLLAKCDSSLSKYTKITSRSEGLTWSKLIRKCKLMLWRILHKLIDLVWQFE